MQHKSEIKAEIRIKWGEISDIVNSCDEQLFMNKKNPDTWSIAEEFDHLIKSAAAVSSAMKVHPFILRWKFGKPNREIRSYTEILHKYNVGLARVNGSAIAPTAFASQDGQILDQGIMLQNWNAILPKLERQLTKWSDKNLDRVLLPHPLLGKMFVREILYFTHLHTEHHRTSLLRKVQATF